ncbi:phage terminase small subunit P27 family [Paludisphaera borealis]|uniref:Phage terminase small subunit P27 family n=1 Tax=Paludisphaera borealis TaxID=1387353 RepID=A0A1U7CXA8_9BACT|nr:phage terminase small subunit P27 family [Paludisphaera borealis]APW63528.1 hypothetical protein BSF38_05100 [Paludisphaera borealis]
MGGKRPAPTSVKKALGVRPARMNQSEPVPPEGAPLPPAYIARDEVALAQWNELVPMLHEMGVLSKADGLILGVLCRAYSKMLMAMEKLDGDGEGEGYTVKGSRAAVASPYIAVEKDARDTILRIANEYGLTAVARSRISVLGGGGASQPGGLAEFLASNPRNKAG